MHVDACLFFSPTELELRRGGAASIRPPFRAFKLCASLLLPRARMIVLTYMISLEMYFHFLLLSVGVGQRDRFLISLG